jgi:hypothetical protein
LNNPISAEVRRLINLSASAHTPVRTIAQDFAIGWLWICTKHSDTMTQEELQQRVPPMSARHEWSTDHAQLGR